MATTMRQIYLTVILAFLYISISEQAPGAQADLDPPLAIVASQNGSYQLKVNGVTWLNSAPTFFMLDNKKYSTDDGSLNVLGVNTTTFTGGPSGKGTTTSIYFQADSTNIIGSITTYSSNVLVTFKVEFPDGAKDINHIDYEKTLCGFPGFVMDGSVTTLGFLSLGGEFAGYTNQMAGQWNNQANLQGGLEGSAPLTLYDKSFNAITIGPQDNFMASSLWRDIDTDNVYWGIMSGVTSLPAGFSYQTMIAYSNDVTQSMYHWGTSLTQYFYPLVRTHDPTAHTIGYWTGEGSYYFNGATGYNNYEDALVDVFAAAKNRSIPYRYVHLGTWWFHKGQGGGVMEWEAPTDVFPNGVTAFHTKMNVPIAASNNFWSNDTIYSTLQGGQYTFDVSDDMALPQNKSFWESIFSKSKQWGMETYIQENMTEIFRQFEEMKTSLTYGRDWLVTMGNAAAAQDIAIQYSGAIPRIALAALEIPSVTQIRVSPDYGRVTDQWKIGLTSVFVHALPVAISKDGFLSQYHEGAMGDPNSERQSVIAALSSGVFETGDEAWKTNFTLVKRSCMSDGTLLRPAQPAVAVDSQILQLAFQDGTGPDGEVWATYSDVTKLGQVGPAQTFGIIFATDLSGSFAITPAMAGFTFEFPRSKIYNAKDPTVQYDFSETSPFTIQDCPSSDFCLFYTAPVFELNEKEVLIMGELNKWIPVSRERIANITITDVITIDVIGTPGEKVEIWFAVDGKIGALAINVQDNGIGSLVYEDKDFGAGSTTSPLNVLVVCLLALIVTILSRRD